MLNSIAVFRPTLCNIRRAPKYPEFAKKDFFGSLTMGRQLAITLPLHLQSQGIFHSIFGYYFCSLVYSV